MPRPKEVLKNINLNKLFPPNIPYFLGVVETISVVIEIPSFLARYFSFFVCIPQKYAPGFLRDIAKFSRSFAAYIQILEQYHQPVLQPSKNFFLSDISKELYRQIFQEVLQCQNSRKPIHSILLVLHAQIYIQPPSTIVKKLLPGRKINLFMR